MIELERCIGNKLEVQEGELRCRGCDNVTAADLGKAGECPTTGQLRSCITLASPGEFEIELSQLYQARPLSDSPESATHIALESGTSRRKFDWSNKND